MEIKFYITLHFEDDENIDIMELQQALIEDISNAVESDNIKIVDMEIK